MSATGFSIPSLFGILFPQMFLFRSDSSGLMNKIKTSCANQGKTLQTLASQAVSMHDVAEDDVGLA